MSAACGTLATPFGSVSTLPSLCQLRRCACTRLVLCAPPVVTSLRLLSPQVGDVAAKVRHGAAALKCLQTVVPAAVMQVASLATMHAATLVRALENVGPAPSVSGLSVAAAVQAAGNARNVLALVYGEEHPRTREAIQLFRMLTTGKQSGGKPRMV